MNVRALLVGWWLFCAVTVAGIGYIYEESAAYVVAGVLVVVAAYMTLAGNISGEDQ